MRTFFYQGVRSEVSRVLQIFQYDFSDTASFDDSILDLDSTPITKAKATNFEMVLILFYPFSAVQ